MDQPSEAQIKAGNYPKGHVYAHGMRISIENPADSVRSGVGKDGEPWDSRMQHDYGYIRGTEGADGDHMDVFLGPDFKSREVPVHVIDQHDDDGKFDEHKVMLGFKDKDAALRAYMGNYPDGYTGARAITPMHIDKFKEWMVGPGAKKSVSKVKKFADGGLIDGQGSTESSPGYQSNIWWDQSTEPVKKAAAPLMSFEDFKASVKPEMLNEQGQFKAPTAGVNYMLEGLTPESAYQTAQNLHNTGDWSEDNRLGKPAAQQQANALLDTDWRTGPNNGGGFLGGLGNAAQGMFDGVRTNPAIMAALSAGVAPYVSKGLASAGMGTAAAKTVTPLIMNAGKTIIGGGSVENALKGAGTGYITGQVGDLAVANNPIPEVLNSNVVKYLAGTAIKGKSADPFGLATAFLTGEAKKPVQKLADGGSIAESDAQAAKDVAHSTQVMKQMLRGWAAGTAGLPGDLEGLARKVVGWGATEGSPIDAWSKRDPVMPTSEFYKEWLPGRPDDPRLREAAGLGSLAGGAGVTNLARPLAKSAGALTKALAEAAPGPMAGSLSAQRGVIKAPGGNWLSGSVEDALKGLKRKDNIAEAEANRRAQGMPEPEITAWRERLAPMQGQNTALNNWVDKQLTRYVKNDMATERDPIRALAEQGTLHFEPQMVPINPPTMRTEAPRVAAGFPKEGLGKSQLAKQWEVSSDDSVTHAPVGDLLSDKRRFEGTTKHIVARENPGFDKLPADTQINDMNGRERVVDLGFDHLMDELRNATNPASGLPRHLQLKPESLNSVSVPQAVKLVSDINKWRAEQKVIANKAVANNPATFTHKEYPDTGFKWVELKNPELPKGQVIKKDVLGIEEVLDDQGRYIAQVGTHKDPRKKHLQDALKYEGDTMGHCVGGYCDDVANGNTRILSLRDAKGEPHATVEVKPGGGHEYAGEQNKEIIRLAKERGIQKYMAPGNEDLWAQAERNLAERGIERPRYIQQIKGKGNKGVADKYRPMVQDFLNTFEHSNAQDLQLNGLRATKDAWNAAELAKIKAAGIEVPRYATQAKIDDIGNIVWPAQWGAAK